LRAQVARRAFLAGCNLGPDDVMVTSGCTEAVSLALAAVCQPGDLVAVESPTYFGLLQILQSLGLKALEIPTSKRTGISLDALRFALDHHRISACLVVPNFQNPLGSCMPLESKSDLVRMLAEHEIPLIEDDIYGELYFQGPRPKVAKSFDRKGLVILCSSFSKDLSPSYRVGWAAPGRFKERMELLKLARNISTPVLLQLAVARFVERGGYDRHLRRIRRAYATKMAAMSQAVARGFPPGTQITLPGGGFLLWAQLPEQVDALTLYHLAIQAGITIAPGCLFSADPARYRNYVRLNAAYVSDSTRDALQELSRLVDHLASDRH
jgi:DNA-binding transcriptional MocR family regulator